MAVIADPARDLRTAARTLGLVAASAVLGLACDRQPDHDQIDRDQEDRDHEVAPLAREEIAAAFVKFEAEEQAESMKSLLMAMAMAGAGIYFVLVLLFNSLTQPILVMFSIPFGLIGIIGAFALHGQPLGFLATMGIIGMMGVVVNDSLILVNFINVRRQEAPESKFLRIVAEGTAGRLRPIILTSITTVAGLLPTAYGLGGDDPFVAVMALALGYGILFATPLTLLLLPCLYMIQHDFGNLLRLIPKFAHFRFIPKHAGLED